MKVGLRAREDEVEGHDATSLALFLFALGLLPFSRLFFSSSLLFKSSDSMELAVFLLLFPSPRLGHHTARFAPNHFVSIFSGAMDLLTCYVMYNLQRPLKNTLALSRTQGCYFSGENGVISTFKEEYIQNTGCLF